MAATGMALRLCRGAMGAATRGGAVVQSPRSFATWPIVNKVAGTAAAAAPRSSVFAQAATSLRRGMRTWRTGQPATGSASSRGGSAAFASAGGGSAPIGGGFAPSEGTGTSAGRLFVAGLAATGVIGIGFYGAKLVANASSTDAMLRGTVEGAWPAYMRERFTSTFAHLGLGIATTGASMAVLFRSGVAHRLAAMNPWVGLGVTLVGTLGTMMATMAIPAENVLAKHAAFFAFNAAIGLSLSSLMFLGPALLLRAAAYTGGIVGSLALVAANSPSEQFLWMGGPLAMGLGVVVVSSLGTMLFPAAAAAPILASVSLYGGLAVFSGFVLYDTSKVMTHARDNQEFDAVNESIGIYMDAVNIFVRIVQILSMMGGNKKK